MEFILGFLLFFIAAYFSFYIPGKLILSRAFPQIKDTTCSLLAWGVGLVVFIFAEYILSWIHYSYFYLLVLVGIFVYATFKDRNLLKIKIAIDDIWSLGIVIVGSLCFLSITAFSYIHTPEGIRFLGTINTIDGLLHIASIQNLLTTFPPMHPGLAGIPLRGYHYFYDLMLSKFVLFYHFTPQDLYYRYFSLFISLIYGAGFVLAGNLLNKDKLTKRLILFFAYFAQSSAFILSFFVHSIGPSAELGSIYPLELILNPAIILSVGLILCFIYLLMMTKPKVHQIIFLGFLFGMITEIKVYTGIVGLIIFGIVIVLRTVQDRQKILIYLPGLITAGFVVAITYLPNNFGAGSLWYSPFFPYSVYMQEPPFTPWNWELRRRIFDMHHNIPRLAILYIQAIGLFWVLSLGSRIIFLLGLPKIFQASFWKNENNLIILVLISVPILIGSLFVQSVSIFDTKQFFWIAGCFIAIPSGVVLGAFLHRVTKVIKIMILLLFLFLSVGGIWGVVQTFILHPDTYTVSSEDVRFFQNTEKIVPVNSSILYLFYRDTRYLSAYPFNLAPVVGAFTKRFTYLELENTLGVGKYSDTRLAYILDLEKQLVPDCQTDAVSNMLAQSSTKYILSEYKNTCLAKIAHQVVDAQDGLTLYKLQ